MIEPVVDRRVRRSQRALRQALVDTSLENGYTNVTVDDICQRADTGRATFYAHFRDKDDLLTSVVEQLRTEMIDTIVETMDGERLFSGKTIKAIFEHATENADLYRLVLRGAGDGHAMRMFSDWMAKTVTGLWTEQTTRIGATPRLPIEVVARAWAGQTFALLSWWLEERPNFTATDMAQMARDLSLYGRLWVLGFIDTDSDLGFDSEGLVAETSWTFNTHVLRKAAHRTGPRRTAAGSIKKGEPSTSRGKETGSASNVRKVPAAGSKRSRNR